MPSSTTSNSVVQQSCTSRAKRNLHWVYVLESLKDKKRYIGYTKNLRKRLIQHQQGKIFSTSFRRPLMLIYLEGCLDEEDSKRREKYLKTTGGRRFLAKRLKSYYNDKTQYYKNL